MERPEHCLPNGRRLCPVVPRLLKAVTEFENSPVTQETGVKRVSCLYHTEQHALVTDMHHYGQQNLINQIRYIHLRRVFWWLDLRSGDANRHVRTFWI